MIIRVRDDHGKEYRIDSGEVGQFAEQMKVEGRQFAPVRTLVNPKTGEEWEGVQWREGASEGKKPWEVRSMQDENDAFAGYLKEGWQHKQWEEPDAWDKIKGFFEDENWTDPEGKQGAIEYNAKNIAAGVGSAAVAGATGLANSIQGTVLNAAAFASRAMGAEGAADAIADVRKETSENIRAMRKKATDAIIDGLDAKGMESARDLVDAGLDVVEGFSGLYGLGAAVGGATKGIAKAASSMGKTAPATTGAAVLAGQMGADAYEHALEELDAQEEASGKEISESQKTLVAGARAVVSAATSKLFGKIAGIGIPPETAQKVVEKSLGRSARILAQEMGEFAAINDMNVLADEMGRYAAGVDRADPDKGVWQRIGEESMHGAGMVLGMKSQKILKGGWNALMPMRVEGFTESMAAMKRAELGALGAASGESAARIVAVTKSGIGVRADGGFVRSAEGEVVSPGGVVILEDGAVRTIGAGRCGELADGEYGIKAEGAKDGRRFGEDTVENACAIVALAETGEIETRRVKVADIAGRIAADGSEKADAMGGIQLRQKEDGTLERASALPVEEQSKPIVVLERNDGAIELVTGRKRVAAAELGGAAEVDAVVIREKDGWTGETAKVIDVVDNLMKGSPVSDAEAVSAANALEIGYGRALDWGLAQNENVAAAFRLRETASTELMGMVQEGSALLPAADAIARNANRSNMPGASREMIAMVQTELVGKMGLGTGAEIDAVCRKLRERDMSPEELWDPIARERILDEAIEAAERERLETEAKKNGLTPEQEAKVENTPVEMEDGTLKTVRATELAEHSSAISTGGDSLGADRPSAGGEPVTMLTVQGGRVTCARFPNVELVRGRDGTVAVTGLTAAEMLKPENREAMTDLLIDCGRKTGGLNIIGEAELAAATELLKARAEKTAIAEAAERKASIQEALGALAESGLAKGVHTDQESFDAKLAESSDAKAWKSSNDQILGFTDGNEIWLNPRTARLETPIHEYGHLGIEMCKKVNRDVYDRGIALAKEIDLFKEISGNEAYKNDSETSRAEEVLATIIGKRGEEALKGAPETLRARVKEWLVDFWKAFGEALGLRDITPERAAKMTLEEVADAIRAEMMGGKRFGEGGKNAAPRNRDGMKYSVAKFSSGKDYVNVDVDQHLFDGKSEKEIQKIARKVIKDRFRGKVIGEAPKNAYVKTKTAEEFAYGGKPMGREVKEAKMRSSTELDNLLAVSEHKWHENDNGSHPEAVGGWDYYETIFKVGDKFFTGKINIMNNKKGRVFYDVTSVKENTQGLMTQYGEPQGQFPGNASHIVPQGGEAAQGGKIRLSIGGIFTGTAADYANRSREGGKDDGPSLLKIGSGEGSQVYGWGLYGSNVRNVAERYASKIAESERRTVKLNGEEIKENSPDVENAVHAIKTWASGNDPLKAAKWLESQASRMRIKIEAGGIKTKLQPIIDRNEAAAKWIRDNADKLEVKDSQEHIYEQTFFTNRAPGDESHLLKWYEPVPKEQFELIKARLAKDGISTEESKLPSGAHGILFRNKETWRNGITGYVNEGEAINAKMVYQALSDVLGSPKAASEFLVHVGIDGVKYPVDSYGGKTVKDGDKAGWNYVSFRDDNIRVDHKWIDGKLKYSVKMIGTDEGVYKTSIDTKNPKTKDGRNTVIFRRDPRECDALLVESEAIKAVEKALPENVKTGDKSIKYTESEKIAVRNFVKKQAKAQRGKVQNPEFGEIIIGRDFEKEVQTHAVSTAREIAAVSSAREIASKMHHFAAAPNEEIKKGRNKYIEYGLATFEFNGERYLVMGEVGIRENSMPYYDQRVVAKLKADASSLSLHAGMKTISAFDEVYDNRFRILTQAAQEASGNLDIRYSAERQELAPSKLGDGKQRYYEVPFADAVDKVVAAKKPIGNEHVFVSETPDVFGKIGFAKLPIMMTQKHVLTIANSADALKDLNISGNAHDMKEVLKQVPSALQKPLMVIASQTKPDVGVVAITQLVDKDGNSVIVPVAVNGLSRLAGGAEIDAHIMTSAYGKGNAWSRLVKDAIEAENEGKIGVFYVDKTRSSTILDQLIFALKQQGLETARLQLPRGLQSLEVVHKITDPGSPVNTDGMVEQTQSRQFREWFGKSKVVDSDGKPLVVYHGSGDNGFTQFDPRRIREKNGVKGFYFAPPKRRDSIAGYYGHGGERAFYLSIKNPLVIGPNKVPTTEELKAHDGIIRVADEDYATQKYYNWRTNSLATERIAKGDIIEIVAFKPTQIKSATDNVGTFDGGNLDIRYSAERQELAPSDGGDVAAWLLRGRLRLADDGKYGLAERGPTPTEAAPVEVRTPSGDLAVVKPFRFALSQLVRLYQELRGNPALPKVLARARQDRRAWLGRITKGSEVELNPEIFGIVNKSDAARIKAELKAEGRFRNEDPGWNLRHSKKQNDYEEMISENALEDRLRSLAEDRVKGKATGENAAGTAVMAHEIAALVMKMPKGGKMTGLAADMRTLGEGIVNAFRKDAANFAKWKAEAAKAGRRFGDAEIEDTNFLTSQALRAVTWWRGYEGGVRTQRGLDGSAIEYRNAEKYFKNNHDELYAEVMGMFLSAPGELQSREPKVFNAIADAIAENQRLLDAYNRIAEGYGEGGTAEGVMRKVEEQWTYKEQSAVAKLERDLKSSTLGAVDKAIVESGLGAWSREYPMMFFLEKKIGEDRALAKEALKIAKKGGDRDEIGQAEENLKKTVAYGDEVIKQMKRELLIKHKGSTGDRMYINEFVSRVEGALKRNGLELDTFDRYLFCQRVIELQGRAMPFGISPSEANTVLEDMRSRLGDVKWRKLEAAAAEFRANRERHILSDEYVQEMFGRERMELWKRNVHYVRTERVMSAEEVALLNSGRNDGSKSLEEKAVDVVQDFETLIRMHQKKGAGSGDRYLKALVGSFGASERPTLATMLNDLTLKEYARRNHFICNLAEMAKELGLPGFKTVRDMSYRSVDGGERYGTLSYMKDGENFLLVVPKEVEKGMRRDPEALGWLVKCNRSAAKMMTTFSVAFAQRNMTRNRESNEANIEWMEPSRLKKVVGGMGARSVANLAEFIAERIIVRLPDRAVRNPLMSLIWNDRTNMHYIAQADRIAKIALNPREFSRVAEEADRVVKEAVENGGDVPRAVSQAQSMLADIDLARELLKQPIISDSYQKVKGYGKGGADVKELFRQLEGGAYEPEGFERLPYVGKVWRGMKDAVRWVEDFNTREEARTKIAAWLAAHNLRKRMEESGESWEHGGNDAIAETVAKSSGSPMGEERGTWWNMLEVFGTGPFANVSMKGAARTIESMRRAPEEWLHKAIWRAQNRAASIVLFAGGGMGIVTSTLKELVGDDEDAQRYVARLEAWGDKMTRAFSMITDYRIKNYDVLPIAMVGEDSVIALGMPRSDEDRLLTPFVDMAVTQALGTKAAESLGFVESISGRYDLPEAVWSGVEGSGLLPDFSRGGILFGVLKETLYALRKNPYNTYTGRPTYDEDLWAHRGERKAEFISEMLKRTWNSMGGRAIMAMPTGPESKRQKAEGEMDFLWTMDGEKTTIPHGATVFEALRATPFASAALSGFVFMNTEGQKRVDRKILQMTEQEKAVRDRIAMECLDIEMEGGSYRKHLNQRMMEYDLDKDDRYLIEESIENKAKALSRKTKKATVPLTSLRDKMPRSTYRRLRKDLIGIGFKGIEE